MGERRRRHCASCRRVHKEKIVFFFAFLIFEDRLTLRNDRCVGKLVDGARTADARHDSERIQRLWLAGFVVICCVVVVVVVQSLMTKTLCSLQANGWTSVSFTRTYDTNDTTQDLPVLNRQVCQ
jgi:hypothetical protein